MTRNLCSVKCGSVNKWSWALIQVTCVSPAEKMSLGVAQCNIKIRLLYIDSGLEILFSSPILVWTLVPVSDWHTQRSLSTPGRPISPIGVTRRNSSLYHLCDRCDRCRSRKRFYFTWNLSRNGNKTKFLRNRPFYTLQSQLKLVLFRSAFAHKFQLQFQRLTTASITFFGPPFHFKMCLVDSFFPSRFFSCCTAVSSHS